MKKALTIIKDVLVWLLVILAVGMMLFTIFSVNTFDQNHRNLMGYKFFVVRSDSMSASDINAGDIVVVKETNPAALQAGDIIAYISQNTENYGEAITHMIRSLTTTSSGEPGFVTYGTTTGADDPIIVTYPYVLGQHTATVPHLGTFFTFLKTTPGYICCIFIPFMLLILHQGINCIRLFRRYRSEQMEELEAERQKLESERTQAAEMMAELQELKAQLAAAKAGEQKEE